MSESGTVLLVSAAIDEWQATAEELADEYGYRVLRAATVAEARARGEDAHVDIVICDQNLRNEDGVEVLRLYRMAHPYVIRILVKGEGDGIGRAISEAAIYQYLRRPLDSGQIGLVVKRALETRELARRHRLLSRELKFHEDAPFLHEAPHHKPRPEFSSFEKLVYASESMAELCELARRAAPTDLPILIQGETGTGKELLARAIHYNSLRKASPLLIQNCGGISDEMLHSELFGHKRGAFTGAVSDRLGLFRAADGGTVFLDEISEVSPSFQVSLLRFLQEGEVKPIGSDQTLVCDVRIIAASNKPLQKLVAQGSFRQDLYFRLKGFELTVPPLRDRPAEIPVLAEFFAKKYGQAMSRRILGIASDALDRLAQYSFPGNIRELENEVRRMVAMASDGGFITAKHLSPAIGALEPRVAKPPAATDLPGETLKDKVEALEKELVKSALTRHRWNQSETARELGLSRVGLANKIKRYGLDSAA
ncbi:MAG TPA: sigma-54 dependent transcriptional regulator [Dongiaceae bacterium]|jgi:two-component system response regulator HupR/HoxA|nr:sigma-54 dependent transcriptional regulator [Dongiaceae bacterium]